MQRSDAELRGLMIRGLDGNAGAYRDLLRDLRPRLSGYFARRLMSDPDEVEDLVQDTLVAIHTRRETYDRGQPLTPWVYAIAHHKLVDRYRQRGRRLFAPLDDAGGDLRVEDGSAAADARRDVERALALLPERARRLLRSLKIDGCSVAEAASLAGLSQGAAKVAAHRAMRTLAGHFAAP
jgi:RNA polymerase sigma-70 factor (ECF subfamily)